MSSIIINIHALDEISFDFKGCDGFKEIQTLIPSDGFSGMEFGSPIMVKTILFNKVESISEIKSLNSEVNYLKKIISDLINDKILDMNCDCEYDYDDCGDRYKSYECVICRASELIEETKE